MRRWLPGPRLIAVSLAAFGCAMPVRVVPIEHPERPAEGVRYLLRRPAYAVSLHLEAEPGDLLDAGAGGGKCIADGTRMVLRIRQTLDGAPEVYEIRRPAFPLLLAHLFSDTGFSVSLDEAGALEAFSASETDRTLEVLEAVAGAVVGVAKGRASAAASSARCFRLPADGFGGYVAEHVDLLEARARVDAAIASVRETLATERDPARIRRAIETGRFLEGERSRLRGELAAIEYPLPRGSFVVTVDGVEVAGADAASYPQPWVSIALTRGAPEAPPLVRTRAAAGRSPDARGGTR